MAKGSNPNTIIARMLLDTQRLERWAQAHGSPKQQEFASNLLKVCVHASNLFSADTTAANPAASKSSWAYSAGLAARRDDIANGTQTESPLMHPQDLAEWKRGYEANPEE
jgi:hypothetical protein